MSRLPFPPADAAGLKYAPGVSARPGGSRTYLRPLEWAVLGHVGIFLLWLTWGFGGGAESMRLYFAWWGSLGGLITLIALTSSDVRRHGGLQPLLWLAPFGAFNAVVLLACLNPSFDPIVSEGETLYVNRGGYAWLPSSARPPLALRALWTFDALYISCFNLALVIQQRRALRGLLLLAVGNALALAVFGTVQKLGGADGIYFGSVPVRQPYFFASFIYHNHWGAFMLLSLAAGLGLAWHYMRRIDARNVLHSPAFAAAVVLFLMAATIPLSGSRSSMLLLGLLTAGALAHGLARIVRHRRRHRESVVPPLLGAACALLLAGAGVWFIARDTLKVRAELTRTQVSTMVAEGSIGSRLRLYGDTWRMAQAKPWFGWGMASYPHAFRLFDTHVSRGDGLPTFYRDAHSDWLQAFAEHGFVGSALLALCAGLPLARLRPHHLRSPLTAYLLSGCAILLLYAWVEFPFGNLAVVFVWWLCLVSAAHYARLQDREHAAATPAVPA